jgi:transposase
MASGHVNRTLRPNTWLHRPSPLHEDSSCQLGANGMDPAHPAGSNFGRGLQRERIIMQVVRIGLDLAKYVFEVHGVDGQGNVVIRKTLRRGSVSTFFANLPPCLVGMEASNGAHWARVLTELGHKVRLISPQFVAPYVKTNKNDRNDAEAICEAVGRPTMRFVPPKSPEQLAVQALHRIRQQQEHRSERQDCADS